MTLRRTIEAYCLVCAVVAAAVPCLLHAYTICPVRHLFTISHGFLQPSDVAVGRDGRVYVVDGVNNAVKVFDEAGTFRFSFGASGAGPGQFKAPLGIATDSAGRVYIADAGNRRIQIFTAGGEWQRTIEIPPEKNKKPADPVDVAVDEAKQQLYAVDNDNHRVLVYSLADWKLLSRWGSEGEDRDQFTYPFFIAAGKDSSVFIVDVINTRVQVWSPKGEPVSTVGSWGVEPGQLYRPKGVCTDKDNTVYVSDSYLGVIQAFNRYGNFKGIVGTEDGRVLKLKTPVGITVDGRQRLYVVEMIENRVSVYELLDTGIQK